MSAKAHDQASFVGRKGELARLAEFQKEVISGTGKTLLISGEAGLGKTCLVEEFADMAEGRGMRILKGTASAEVGQPFLVFSQALEPVVTGPLFEEHEYQSFRKIFAVNKAGMLVAEASSGEEDMDADIFAGMLSAVQDFVRDSFDQVGSQSAGLGRLEYGDLKIMVEHGEGLFLTAVFEGEEHADMKGLVKHSVRTIMEEYGSTLASWKGNMDDVAGVQAEVESLAESRFFVKKNLEGVKLDNERVRLSDKVLGHLVALSQDRPVLVVLEDLHWADESSLFVLKYLARNVPRDRIFLLGTFRPGESDVLRGVVEAMAEEGTFQELTLTKFDDAGVSRLADEIFPGHSLPPTLFGNLAKRCEGNPLFVKEMLWQMGEDGSIVRGDGGYTLVNEEYSIPDTVQDIVARRLANLDAGALALAEYVSCEGMDFSGNLAKSYQLAKDVTVSLETLTSFGLLTRFNDSYRFSHAVYRDCLYTSVGDRWKRAYHKSLGEYYESAYRHSPDEAMYELARHFSRSNEHAKALEYCLKAGEMAESAYSPEQAGEYFHMALDALRNRPHDVQDEADIHARLGEVNTLLASNDEAIADLEKACDLSENDEFKTRMMNKIAWICLKKGESDRASEILEQSLAKALESDIKAQVAQAHNHYGILYIKSGDYPTALNHLETSLDIRKAIDADAALPETYSLLGLLHNRMGDVHKAIEFYQEGLEIAERAGDKVGIANALSNLGIQNWYLGDMDAAREHFLRSLEIRKSTGDKSGTGISYDNIAGVYGIKGDLDKSIEYYERGIAIFRQTGERVYLANLLSNVSLYYQHKGDMDNALARAGESLELMEAMGNKRGVALALVNLVKINAERGDADKALEMAESSLEIATEVNLNRELGLVHASLGAAHQAKGNWKTSREEFEKAHDLFKEFEDALSEATMYYDYAGMLSDPGNPEPDARKAGELLGKALAIFEESDMKLWVDKCREALDGLSERRPES